MKLFIACCLCLLLCNTGYGQRYRYWYAQITTQADSLLSAQAGSTIFPYCNRDGKACYYSYGKNKIHFKTLGKGKTHKHFTGAVICYNILMPYPMCPCMDTIRGRITLTLDTALHLTDIDTNIIPAFVTADDSCRFLSKERAIALALLQNLHTSVSGPYAYIKRSGPDNTYVWIVLRTIWNEKNASGKNPARDDMVIIDAQSGAVKEHKVIPYAPHVY